MKRSEIIKELEKVLELYYVPTTPYEVGAVLILNTLEQKGMLPPYREKTEEEKELIDAINQYKYCHRWEKE